MYFFLKETYLFYTINSVVIPIENSRQVDPDTRWTEAAVDTDTSRQNRISLNNMVLLEIEMEKNREIRQVDSEIERQKGKERYIDILLEIEMERELVGARVCEGEKK